MMAFSIIIMKNNTSKYIGNISESEYDSLKDTFECYRDLTGVSLDLYKKNIIHNDSISIILSCFKKMSKTNNTVLEKYKNLFELVKESGYNLVLDGN